MVLQSDSDPASLRGGWILFFMFLWIGLPSAWSEDSNTNTPSLKAPAPAVSAPSSAKDIKDGVGEKVFLSDGFTLAVELESTHPIEPEEEEIVEEKQEEEDKPKPPQETPKAIASEIMRLEETEEEAADTEPAAGTVKEIVDQRLLLGAADAQYLNSKMELEQVETPQTPAVQEEEAKMEQPENTKVELPEETKSNLQNPRHSDPERSEGEESLSGDPSPPRSMADQDDVFVNFWMDPERYLPQRIQKMYARS